MPVHEKDEMTIKRKEKRWVVLKRPFAIHNNELIFPSASHPLHIQLRAAYQSGSTTIPEVAEDLTLEDSWILDSEISSFDEVKARVVELAKTLGLDRIRVCRAVDLYTVLYPIA